MIKGYETKILKINKPLRGLNEGVEIPVKADKEGTLLDMYWRRRLVDSEVDNCVEIVGEKSKTKSKKKED